VLAESKGSEMFGLNFQFFPETMGQNGKLLAEKQTHTHYFKSTALGTNYVTPRTAFMWVALIIIIISISRLWRFFTCTWVLNPANNERKYLCERLRDSLAT